MVPKALYDPRELIIRSLIAEATALPLLDARRLAALEEALDLATYLDGTIRPQLVAQYREASGLFDETREAYTRQKAVDAMPSLREAL